MWKFILLNGMGFFILLLVHLFGNEVSRRAVLAFMVLVVFLAAGCTNVDPFAWFFYSAYAAAVFYGAAQFREWVAAQTAFLDARLGAHGAEEGAARRVLEEKSERAGNIERQATELASLYDHTKDMTQGRTRAEVFLAFGEALSGRFSFQSGKLVVVEEEDPASSLPQQVLEMQGGIFGPEYDREAVLKDPRFLEGDLYPAEKAVVEKVLSEKKPWVSSAGPELGFAPLKPTATAVEKSPQTRSAPGLTAFPVVMEGEAVAALLLRGFEGESHPHLAILLEGFASDIERLRLYARVERMAITDGLTEVYVRRHLLERLDGEADRCRRFGLKMSFLMIDVDHFKNFNDRYGHLVGDVVLKKVASTVRKNIREIDLVGRYGGEEFGVILVETDEQAALAVAERIRRSISEKPFQAYDESLSVTVSVGCATFSKALTEASSLMEAADSALYRAKRQGRNRVCTADAL